MWLKNNCRIFRHFAISKFCYFRVLSMMMETYGSSTIHASWNFLFFIIYCVKCYGWDKPFVYSKLQTINLKSLGLPHYKIFIILYKKWSFSIYTCLSLLSNFFSPICIIIIFSVMMKVVHTMMSLTTNHKIGPGKSSSYAEGGQYQRYMLVNFKIYCICLPPVFKLLIPYCSHVYNRKRALKKTWLWKCSPLKKKCCFWYNV